MLLPLLAVAALLAGGLSRAGADEAGLIGRPDVLEFIDTMVARHAFARERLMKLFREVRTNRKVISAISRPAESKPWHQYRPIFITAKRIHGGVKFWNAHHDTLARAETVYGVPPEIVTAILGVETYYGRQKGGYRVMDSLATLAFDYPPRERFFRGELEEYLLLAREENIDPLALQGSYAGAMGKPQFIASSYRRYAVDFDGDEHRDLWNNTADAIGSIAYYLKTNGWEQGAPIAARARIIDERARTLADKGMKPHTTLSVMRRLGVETEAALAGDEPAALIALENKGQQEYWVGLQNFYVITRYNHSALYAMAVYQLGKEIKRQRQKALANK